MITESRPHHRSVLPGQLQVSLAGSQMHGDRDDGLNLMMADIRENRLLIG